MLLHALWYPQEEEYLQQLLERRARERYIQKERNELQKQLKVRTNSKTTHKIGKQPTHRHDNDELSWPNSVMQRARHWKQETKRWPP